MIQSVSPSAGQAGTLVTISGARLLANSTSLASVTIRGVAAEILSFANDQLIVQAKSASAGHGSILIAASTGATILGTNLFTYLVESVINSVDPTQGQEGTVVTVTGERLTGGGSTIVTVKLAGVTASIISQDSATVVASAAASGAASGDVVLTSNTGALSTKVNSWTYLQNGVITAVSPSSGQ